MQLVHGPEGGAFATREGPARQPRVDPPPRPAGAPPSASTAGRRGRASPLLRDEGQGTTAGVGQGRVARVVLVEAARVRSLWAAAHRPPRPDRRAALPCPSQAVRGSSWRLVGIGDGKRAASEPPLAHGARCRLTLMQSARVQRRCGRKWRLERLWSFTHTFPDCVQERAEPLSPSPLAPEP